MFGTQIGGLPPWQPVPLSQCGLFVVFWPRGDGVAWLKIKDHQFSPWLPLTLTVDSEINKAIFGEYRLTGIHHEAERTSLTLQLAYQFPGYRYATGLRLIIANHTNITLSGPWNA